MNNRKSKETKKCNGANCYCFELQLLYTDLTNCIQFIKQQQWNSTYYSALLIAAIIGFNGLLTHPTNNVNLFEKWVMFLTAFAISIACTLYLFDCQKQLRKYRVRLVKLIHEFSTDIHEKVFAPIPKTYQTFWLYDFLKIVFPMVLTLFIEVCFVAWIVFR